MIHVEQISRYTAAVTYDGERTQELPIISLLNKKQLGVISYYIYLARIRKEAEVYLDAFKDTVISLIPEDEIQDLFRCFIMPFEDPLVAGHVSIPRKTEYTRAIQAKFVPRFSLIYVPAPHAVTISSISFYCSFKTVPYGKRKMKNYGLFLSGMKTLEHVIQMKRQYDNAQKEIKLLLERAHEFFPMEGVVNTRAGWVIVQNTVCEYMPSEVTVKNRPRVTIFDEFKVPDEAELSVWKTAMGGEK